MHETFRLDVKQLTINQSINNKISKYLFTFDCISDEMTSILLQVLYVQVSL